MENNQESNSVQQEGFTQNNKTFCQFGSQDGGVAEIDLAYSVERGEINKFLAITVINYAKKRRNGRNYRGAC